MDKIMLRLSPKAASELEMLMALRGVTMAQLIRVAVGVVHVWIEAEVKGQRLAVVDKRGEVVSVLQWPEIS